MKKLIVALTAIILLASCNNITQNLLNPNTSQFKEYADSLDEQKMKEYLQAIIQNDTVRWTVDKVVKQRYDSIMGVDDKCALWFDEDGVSADVDTLLHFMRSELPKHGLNQERFYLSEIENDLDVVEKLAFDSVGRDINEVLVHLDYHLSKAYARYMVGMQYGFTLPDKMMNRLYYRSDRGYWAHLFDYEIEKPDYEKLWQTLQSADRVKAMENLAPANAQPYRQLQTQLSKTSDKDQRRKLLVNMERCRWRIQHPKLEDRGVLVNLPAQQLWTLGKSLNMSMKVCCGAWDTKTPLLSSLISYMQVNPEWSLPPKIVASDFVRHVGDSAWFARHKYFVVDRKTSDTLNIASLGASGMKNQRLRFVQRGGAGNSLGRIVFRFDSKFSIYLHDTNTPGVFGRDRRTVSHGCIRVEKPFDLACYLLPELTDWDKDRLRISMDIAPQTERGMKYVKSHANSRRPFRLFDFHRVTPKVPVYIVYYTAYPNPQTGVVEYWPDIYAYDNAIAENMGKMIE